MAAPSRRYQFLCAGLVGMYVLQHHRQTQMVQKILLSVWLELEQPVLQPKSCRSLMDAPSQRRTPGMFWCTPVLDSRLRQKTLPIHPGIQKRRSRYPELQPRQKNDCIQLLGATKPTDAREQTMVRTRRNLRRICLALGTMETPPDGPPAQKTHHPTWNKQHCRHQTKHLHRRRTHSEIPKTHTEKPPPTSKNPGGTGTVNKLKQKLLLLTPTCNFHYFDTCGMSPNNLHSTD